MAVYDYAEQFSGLLVEKYKHEAKSYDLTQSNLQVTFINAQTIKLPSMTVSGYKDHTRTAGFNAGTINNSWEAKKLAHDRDVEFFVDPMDVDETNLVLSMANIQNTFETEQAIPEMDSYRFSKLHSELTRLSGKINKVALTTANILTMFDEAMCAMDEAGVPNEGRILYVTPTVNKLLKEAEGIQRMMLVTSPTDVNRNIHSLDDVRIVVVPSARMKSKYNFTTGFAPAGDAKQINFILIHPSCVVCRIKHAYAKVFTPGSDSRCADGYLFQTRSYGDLFLLDKKVDGCFMNVEA